MSVRVNYKVILSLLVAAAYFPISFYVLSYYQGGDQIHYRNFYNGLDELDFLAAFDFYRNSLGTSEPGYFLFAYVFSQILPKDIVFSLVNSVFVFVLLRHLFRINLSYVVILILSFNFYLLVLLFSAERLKLSLLFMLIYLHNPVFSRYNWLFFSIFTHVQVLLIYIFTQSGRVVKVLRSLYHGRAGFNLILIAGVFFMVVFFLFLMFDHILSKAIFYYGVSGGWQAVVKPVIFFLLTILYSKNRSEAFLIFSIIVFLSFFVGSERLTIFSYLVFIYYASAYRKGLNFGVVVTSLYFLFKGIVFLNNIFIYGDGFAL